MNKENVLKNINKSIKYLKLQEVNNEIEDLMCCYEELKVEMMTITSELELLRKKRDILKNRNVFKNDVRSL
jgi:hypothetical protein